MKDFFDWTCIAFVLIGLAGGGVRVLDGIANAIAMFRARREQKPEIEVTECAECDCSNPLAGCNWIKPR